tara:strand:+ start:1036 stop:1272 length:237 start_codon:yes stop_codon:yes gene_type:complete
MDIDAVIIEVEFQLESDYQPYGHFVCLRFIDNFPQKTKLTSLIKDMGQYPDVKLIDYEFKIEKITEATDITGLEITKH